MTDPALPPNARIQLPDGAMTHEEAAVYWMNRWDTETQELQLQLTDARQTIASLGGLTRDLQRAIAENKRQWNEKIVPSPRVDECPFCGAGNGHTYNCGQGGGR
jgi:hypothetical protein